MAKKLINKEEAFTFKTNKGDTMDLNDFKEPGFYHSIVNAKMHQNLQLLVYFCLYRKRQKYDNSIFISYFYETKLKLYSRFYTLNTWSSWITI